MELIDTSVSYTHLGKEKEKIITAALQGGLVDSLYIDEPTAELIVRHN